MKNKWILFWRVARECLRRAVTPFLMYLMCSMVAVACLSISVYALQVILIAGCILLAVVLDADLSFAVGKKHYQMLMTGNIRRRNNMETFSNKDKKSYRYEMEYRRYKGFIIGACICIPVVAICLIYVVGGFDTTVSDAAYYGKLALLLISGWAIIPWELIEGEISLYFSLASCVLPICVTGISYLLGARKERNDALAKESRMEAIKNAGKESNRAKKKRERENRY